MTNEDIIFGEEGDAEASDSAQSEQKSRVEHLENKVEDLEEQLGYLRSNTTPDIRKVETKNGVRYIVEFSVSNWFKPAELQNIVNSDVE